jgi:large subunit ribosomal protein L34e
MTRRSIRGGAKKRVQIRLPGNRSVTHYKKEKIKGAHCVRCGQFFASVPRLTKTQLAKLFPTQRKITRPYGGQLCHNCVRELIKQAVRT